MSLSWKDAGATLLAAGVVTLAFVTVRELAAFLTVRWAIAGMLILGIGTCAVGAYSADNIPPLYAFAMDTLVVISVVAAILGLVFGNKAYAIILATTLGVLWLASTIRHAVI